MDRLAPDGPVYQAGTLSGNPLAVAAGIATMGEISRDGFYPELESRASALQRGLLDAASSARVPAAINRVGSMLTLFFTGDEVTGYDSARGADVGRYGSFFRAMREEGVNLPPSQFEAWFVSAAHSDDDVERTVKAARSALSAIS
jgi:glutamate-1-semialdehyde 2,1-aminomutase